MARSETNILNRIRLHLAGSAVTFRNNVGLFTTDRGDKVRTGLCKGSSDLVGWASVKVTPEMVGSVIAVFTAIEVKGTRGRLTKEQRDFIAAVRLAGGFSFVARSGDEAEARLKSQVGELQEGAAKETSEYPNGRPSRKSNEG